MFEGFWVKSKELNVHLQKSYQIDASFEKKILSWLISSSSVKLGDYSMNQQNSSEWQENTSTWVSVLFVWQCNANHVPKDALNISCC